MTKKLILAGVFLLQLSSICSHAALFDDKEARKKILEVEATMKSQNQATQTELSNIKSNIEPRLNALEAVAKGSGLMDMQNQLELMKAEVAKLKGELEVANHTLESIQQRQKDLYTDTDTRLRKLEGGTAHTTSTAPSTAAVAASPDVMSPATTTVENQPAVDKSTTDYKLIETANNLVKSYKYKEAYDTYDKFIKDYPRSVYVADAMYGLGYTQFALKNYKSSLATQQKVVELYPDSPKVPEALLNMTSSQIQLGLIPVAKKTLRDLISKYPNSEVIPIAQKRLKSLEALK